MEGFDPPAIWEMEYESVCAGPGALCPEAQADGVPCDGLGKDCVVCRRARSWELEGGRPDRRLGGRTASSIIREHPR